MAESLRRLFEKSFPIPICSNLCCELCSTACCSNSTCTQLTGGEYESLHVFNREIDPNDHVALWTWVCDNKLLQSLEPRSAELTHQESDTYVFQVEFTNPDGSLFVLGPCCGANETEMPPVSQFEFTITQNADGKFVVMNTPPYVP